MAITKPQKPLMVNEQEIYPLTSVDQVVMESGERLNATLERLLVPSFTEADYGKILGCSITGLQWVDSQSELVNAEEVSF